MKKLMSLAAVGAVLATTAMVSAAPPPAPAPEGVTAKPVPVAAAVVPLYECVEYKDLDEMAPCAVSKIVEVPEPRRPCCRPAACGCAAPVARKCCAPVARKCCAPVAPPKCCAPVAAKCGAPVAASCCCPPPRCVKIRICVPPYGCERVKVNRKGDRIRYDYGKYAVDIRIKKDHIEVDYQD